MITREDSSNRVKLIRDCAWVDDKQKTELNYSPKPLQPMTRTQNQTVLEIQIAAMTKWQVHVESTGAGLCQLPLIRKINLGPGGETSKNESTSFNPTCDPASVKMLPPIIMKNNYNYSMYSDHANYSVIGQQLTQ